MKPKNLVAKDLRTPKYRMRVVESKVHYTRKTKHKGHANGIPAQAGY
jgi:hypothetical protein